MLDQRSAVKCMQRVCKGCNSCVQDDLVLPSMASAQCPPIMPSWARLLQQSDSVLPRMHATSAWLEAAACCPLTALGAHYHGPAASLAAAAHPSCVDQAMMHRAHVVHQRKASWHAALQRCHTSHSRLQAAAPGPTVNTQSLAIGPVLDFIALPESPKAERPAGLAGASDKSSGQTRADAIAGGGPASLGGPSLPWGRVSGRIQSPLLRLHTGAHAGARKALECRLPFARACSGCTACCYACTPVQLPFQRASWQPAPQLFCCCRVSLLLEHCVAACSEGYAVVFFHCIMGGCPTGCLAE